MKRAHTCPRPKSLGASLGFDMKVDGRDVNTLLAEVAAWTEYPNWSDLTPEVLRRITANKGIDFATGLCFDRITQSSEHGAFIRETNACLESPQKTGCQLDASLIIVPGLSYEEHPEVGGDGRMVREEAERLGLRTSMIPTRSLGKPTQNAEIICDWLIRHSRSPVVLVSLSKGATDVKMALAHRKAEAAFRHVIAWINVGGLLSGSPMVGWMLDRWWATCLGRTSFWAHQRDYELVREVDPRSGGQLDFALNVPDHMNCIHVAAFPLKRHVLNPRARLWHRRLAPEGPNDGMMMLSDLCGVPGHIYPVWGVDHYMEDLRALQRLIPVLIQSLERVEVGCESRATTGSPQ